LCGGEKNKSTKGWLPVQSGVGCCPCCLKNVHSKLVSFKLAGRPAVADNEEGIKEVKKRRV